VADDDSNRMETDDKPEVRPRTDAPQVPTELTLDADDVPEEAGYGYGV
jgi:hypothetical protein